MEGYIGEVRMFGGSFAPAGWMLCQGQQLSLAGNEVLYAIIGTIYGGDGVNSFNLPGIASRSVVGAGQGPGLSSYVLGQVSGNESITLLTSQLPAHTHAATVQTDVTAPSATAALYGSDTGTGLGSPSGALYGQDPNAQIYAASTATPVAMASNAITVNSFAGPLPTVTVAAAGSSLPHNNLQPYTSVNFIICVQGIFPSRN